MSFCLSLALVLAQTPPPVAVSPESPPAAPQLVPSKEAVRASPDEPPEVKAFATFVERHLLTLDTEQAQGFKLRQRERSFTIRDEDFTEAFTLVPEALTLAQRAQDSFRLANIFQIVGLSLSGLSLALVVIAPLVVSGAGFLPLIAVGLVGSLIAVVLTVISVPFSMAASNQFFSAVATYNKGLLDLRPAPAGLVPPPQGLSIPLP
jgi:hypothetical protein